MLQNAIDKSPQQPHWSLSTPPSRHLAAHCQQSHSAQHCRPQPRADHTRRQSFSALTRSRSSAIFFTLSMDFPVGTMKPSFCKVLTSSPFILNHFDVVKNTRLKRSPLNGWTPWALLPLKRTKRCLRSKAMDSFSLSSVT